MEEDEDDGNGANEAQAMPPGLIQSDLLAQAKDRNSAGSDNEGDANLGELEGTIEAAVVPPTAEVTCCGQRHTEPSPRRPAEVDLMQ